MDRYVGARARGPARAVASRRKPGALPGLLAAALALLLVLSLLPLDALAAGRSSAGEMGARIRVEASIGTSEQGSEIGIRISVPVVSKEQTSEAGTIGVRMSIPAPASQLAAEGGTIGIRMSIPASSTERASEAGAIGIRISVPESESVAFSEAGTIGIRVSTDLMNEYTVTFDSMGGSPVESQRVRHGSSAAMPASPTRPGYAFVGWHADYLCKQDWNFDNEIVTDVVLYAGWVEADYTVSVTFDGSGGRFDASHGGGGTYTRTDVLPGQPVTDVLPADPVREGCAFAGWWTSDGSGADGWGERVTALTSAPSEEGGTLTVYARWVAARVAVEFEDPSAGGGAGSTVVWRDALNYGHVLLSTGPKTVPRKAGYLLRGLWYAGQDGAAAGGAPGDGDTGADSGAAGEVQYYGYSYTDSASGSAWDAKGLGWTAAIDGPWDMVDHVTLDRYGADGTDGADGVPDTVVLQARWDLIFEATIPVSVGVSATAGEGNTIAEVLTPDLDRFAITSYTVEPIAVDGVSAEGLDEGGHGLSNVFCTPAEGASGGARGLDYALMGGDIDLTLDAASDPGDELDASDRLTLTIASDGKDALPAGPVASACTSQSADSAGAVLSDKFAIAGSDGEGASRLYIKFGLECPDGLRLYNGGRSGDIAKVTFTLSATQR